MIHHGYPRHTTSNIEGLLTCTIHVLQFAIILTKHLLSSQYFLLKIGRYISYIENGVATQDNRLLTVPD